MAPTELSLALLTRIRGGDQAAFEQFFRYWYPRLANHAAQFLGRSDAAEDAVQEVMVAIWRTRESLPELDKLPAYLHRSVRNRALNQLRGNRMIEPAALESSQHADSVRADDQLREDELADAVAASLSELAPRTREVFLLSREHGLTYQAIADTLGISVKTVETLMGRGLRALRASLLPKLED